MLCGDTQMTLEADSVLFFAPPFTMMRSFRTPQDTFRHRYGRLGLTTAQKAASDRPARPTIGRLSRARQRAAAILSDIGPQTSGLLHAPRRLRQPSCLT